MTEELNLILKSFTQNRFDPQTDSEKIIPNLAGNYIICLKSNSKFPKVQITPIFTKFNKLNVIYTGIASENLRKRDYKQHFKGNNAGRSTLRKSLGVLFGYKLIPRDKNSNTGKTKFSDKDENKLSDWMCKNLVIFFMPTTNFAEIEILIIKQFNPPLNLINNHNQVNVNFRKLLLSMRNEKTRTEIHKFSINTENNTTKRNARSQKIKTNDISEIIKAIDQKLIETGKHYLLLGEANQLLLKYGLVKNNKVLKHMLENREIPYAQQINGAVRQWRIPLSNDEKYKRENIKEKANKKNIESKKSITNQQEIQEITNPKKVILIIIAICFWFSSLTELLKADSSDFDSGFFVVTFIVGILIYLKAKKIKPRVFTMNSLSNTSQINNANLTIQQNNNSEIPIKKSFKRNSPNNNRRQTNHNHQKYNINEDEIYGLASEFGEDAVEDEVRNYIDYDMEKSNDKDDI